MFSMIKIYYLGLSWIFKVLSVCLDMILDSTQESLYWNARPQRSENQIFKEVNSLVVYDFFLALEVKADKMTFTF